MSPTLTETSRARWLVGDDAHVYGPALFLSLPVAHTGWDFNRPLVLPEAITASKPAWTLWVEATHWPAPPDAAALISELRDRTDLTWEECARLFGVSRRTAHYWAKGANAMTAAHQRRLSQILEIVRDFDASAKQMQAALRSSAVRTASSSVKVSANAKPGSAAPIPASAATADCLQLIRNRFHHRVMTPPSR